MSKKKPSGPKGAVPPEPRAADLLPPDGPAPTQAQDVRPADASLEPEVETRKIGIRRVSCLDFGNRFYARANWRPAGNSRAFWSKIEADDPFKKPPARPMDAPLEVYAAQRIERTEGSLPKPQPEVARAYPPPQARPAAAEADAPPPKPRREAPPARPRREMPEPSHTPEPRPAPRPPPRAVEPEPAAPEPAPPQADQVVPAPPRRLPPRPQNPKATSGRMQTAPGRQRMPSAAPGDRPSAAEIREQKLRARELGTSEPEPVKKHDLDTYRNFVQLMEIQQAAHERGEEVPRAFADTADDAPRPKPKAIAKRPKAEEPEPPAEEPVRTRSITPRTSSEPAAPPAVDRSPPRAAKPGEPPAPPRPGPAAGGNLDDLFGGGNEGRVRIGKRVKKTDTPPEET